MKEKVFLGMGSTILAGRTEIWPISLRQQRPYPYQSFSKLDLTPLALDFPSLTRN